MILTQNRLYFSFQDVPQVVPSRRLKRLIKLKMVRAGSAPLDAASGLARIKELAGASAFQISDDLGKIRDVAEAARAAYVERICQFVDVSALTGC